MLRARGGKENCGEVMKAIWRSVAAVLMLAAECAVAMAMAPSDAALDLPLAFEANLGQTDEQVLYIARAPGYAAFLTATQAVLSRSSAQESHVVSMRLLGGNADA